MNSNLIVFIFNKEKKLSEQEEKKIYEEIR